MAAADDLRRFQGSRYAPLAPARPAPKPAPRPKPKPKKRPKPKAPPKQALPAADPIARAVRQVGRTAGRAAPTTARAVRRSVAARPGARVVRRQVDPDFAALLSDVEEYENRTRGGRERPVSQAGPGNLIERLNAARDAGGNPLGRVIGNLGSDALSVVTGLPSAAVLAGKTTAYPILKLTGQEGGEQVEEDIKQAGKAVARDYSTRYGPLFRGDLRGFGEQAMEHPGLLALDVAGAYSGAGAAVRGAASTVGTVASGTRLGARAARMGSKAIGPGTARYRTPRALTVGMSDEPGAAARAAATTRAARRPYSANPMTRGVQKAAGRAYERAGRALEVRRPDLHQRRYDITTRRQARDYRLAADMEAAGQLDVESRAYRSAVRDLEKAGKWSREQVDAALFLHGTDQLRVPGKTVRQAANDVAAFMERGQSGARAAGLRVKKSVRNPEVIRSLPDELLDISKGPKELRAAVDEYRALAGAATKARVQAGTISPQTAIEAPARRARMVHEGLRYEHKSGLWLGERNPYSPVGARAVYVKDIALDQPRGGQSLRASAGQMGRRTLDKEYASHGTLYSRGNVTMDRGLPIKSMERAIADRMHPTVMRDFNETFAFRNPRNDKVARGPRAEMAFKADPDNVTLVSVRSMEDAMRRADDLPEGTMPDSPLRKGGPVEMYEGKDGLAALEKLPPGRRSDLIALPTAAVKGMREGWKGIAGGRIKYLDTPTELWKRGILSFAPRYYLNSLFGNTIMYGMATGGDVRSVYQVMRNQKLRDAIPRRIRNATNVAEARISEVAPGTRAGAKYRKITDRLIGKQAAFDSLFREALYVRRVKQGLRAEGAKVRSLSPDDLAEAVRKAPKHVVDQAMRETELFLGDYLRLSPIERGLLRRAFPFYSWMRVIGRFMLEVPVRHPKRAAITAMAARAAAEVENPEDEFQRILANRGRINIGPYSMRTAGANPLFTHADILKNVTGGDIKGTLGALASNTSPIVAQQILRNYSGTTAFGAPVSFPPGYGGTASTFGRPTQRIDPVTGLPDYYDPGVPLSEQILQTIPLVPQVVRGVASGGRRPYDVTTTLDLLTRSKPDSELFLPDRDRAMEPIPGVGPFLGWAGLNFQRRDRAQEMRDYRKLLKDFEEAQRQTKRRKRKARRG